MSTPMSLSEDSPPNRIVLLKLLLRGAVQGVGFRPFVYRLARELALTGSVRNSTGGVVIEVEGAISHLEQFQDRLVRERPPLAFIQSMEGVELDPSGFSDFQILESVRGDQPSLVLPDVATCEECLREVLQPSNRRYFYPFTNCTNCGPRYSIIESLPYDRARTSMRHFPMCAQCQAEFDDPLDRRFHAQPNACPVCGPQLEFWSVDGSVFSRREEAIETAATLLRQGRIVAVKGLGGFHLMVDARNDSAVHRLRIKKQREEKPLAVMFPELKDIESCCRVSSTERRVLQAPESPIILLQQRRNPSIPIASSVAPGGNPRLGALLPYTPLHHLLLKCLGFPVVATSGNLSDEPICIDVQEAVQKLGDVADGFLVHDRPIVRHVDDSVVTVMGGRELVLRRARGFTPLPLELKEEFPPVIAVGAHLKNSVAVSHKNNIFISQHNGDLGTEKAFLAFQKTIDCLSRLFEVQPRAVACDLHPDYPSTRFARQSGLPVIAVQHHFAHLAACMGENQLQEPVLGVIWDGSGYGPDGTVWGGEFLLAHCGTFERMAHLRTFSLPGSEQAVREPRRAALGVLFELMGPHLSRHTQFAPVCAFRPAERTTLLRMLSTGLNSPRSSSMGRLFDCVASLLDLRHICRFEGQAAMELEFALKDTHSDDAYLFEIQEAAGERNPLIVDWKNAVMQVQKDKESGLPAGEISARFHNGLIEALVEVAKRSRQTRIVLSGGCFQNHYLTERAVFRLRQEGFQPYWHQRIPPNDGGISVGQVVAAASFWKRKG